MRMCDSLFYFVLCRNTELNEDKDDSFGISLDANRITQASPGSSVLGSPLGAPGRTGQSLVMGEQADTRWEAGLWTPQADTSRLKEQQSDSSAS